MGFFSRKIPEENKIPVLKSNLVPEQILQRHPQTDFISGTVLEVAPGQEAVFVKDGDAEIFTAGRYVLETNEVPKMRKFYNKNYQGGHAFNCYVYFINKEKPVKFTWGGGQQLTDIDSELKIKIGASGYMMFTISDSIRFIHKVSGQASSWYSDNLDEGLRDKWKNEAVSIAFEALLEDIDYDDGFNDNKAKGKKFIRYEELATRRAGIAEKIAKLVREKKTFEEYGLYLKEATCNLIPNPEDVAKIEEFMDNLTTERRQEQQRMKLDAQRIRTTGFAEGDVMGYQTKAQGFAEAEVLAAKGNTGYYGMERGYDVLQTAAGNQSGIGGGTSFVGAGVGLGMGLGLGGGLGSAMGNLASNALNPNQFNAQQQPAVLVCPTCKTQNPAGTKFCGGCGQSLVPKGPVCPKCGQENAPGTKFCGGCGTSLEQPKANACPKCGAEHVPGAKFCGGCGALLEQPKENVCPKCGAENAPGAKFCNGCGALLEQPKENICPSCGTVNEQGAKFCNSCGTKLG